jgi:LAGLIDADG endonuclease
MRNKGVSYQVNTGHYANFTSLAAPKNQPLNPNFITGFIDGEGCFHITMAKKTGYRTGYSVNLSFSIGLHSKDTNLLRSIQEYFGGIGILSVSDSTVSWRVFSVKELKVIISHLDVYPLLTKKYLDFVLFKESFRLFVNKNHLTDEGLINMASIKASMNKGLSETLKAAFPTYGIIDPLSLSKGLIATQVGKSINPY